MSNKIKNNSLKIIKLNNIKYIPFQLHQLPKWFNKYNIEHINARGYCYILLEEHYMYNTHFNYERFKDTLSYNKDLNYVQKR